jgi:hypothetical protein
MKLTREQIENMPASREIDALVAEFIMGEKKPIYLHSHPIVTQTKYSINMSWYCLPEYEKGDVCEWIPKPYSTDIAAAWEVVETFDRKSWDVSVSSLTDNDDEVWEVFFAEYFEDGVGRIGKASAETAPLAICRAALIAMMDIAQ